MQQVLIWPGVCGSLFDILPKTLLIFFLLAGNLEPNEAESMIQYIEDVFFKGPDLMSRALFASQYMTNRIVKLERGINYFYSAEGLNPSDENSALVHYMQV